MKCNLQPSETIVRQDQYLIERRPTRTMSILAFVSTFDQRLKFTTTDTRQSSVSLSVGRGEGALHGTLGTGWFQAPDLRLAPSPDSQQHREPNLSRNQAIERTYNLAKLLYIMTGEIIGINTFSQAAGRSPGVPGCSRPADWSS